jgi:hypothetical protein
VPGITSLLDLNKKEVDDGDPATPRLRRAFQCWSAEASAKAGEPGHDDRSPGTIQLLIDWPQSTGDSAMSDEAPPLVYDGLDPAPEPKPTIEKVSEAVKDTAQRVGRAIDAGRKPGMPLSILSNIAREAPLGSLLVAFLLGVAFARRR